MGVLLVVPFVLGGAGAAASAEGGDVCPHVFQHFVLPVERGVDHCERQYSQFHPGAGCRALPAGNDHGGVLVVRLYRTVCRGAQDRPPLRRHDSWWTGIGTEEHDSGYLDGADLPEPAFVGGARHVCAVAEHGQLVPGVAEKQEGGWELKIEN